MATIEKLIVQIFDRKRQIIEQLKQQKLLYDQHLASKLLIQGISPPSWLLPSDFPPTSTHLSALDKAGLISSLLHPRPGPAASCPDGGGFSYDKPLLAVNDAASDEPYAGNFASCTGCDEDGSSGIPLFHVGGTKDRAGIVHPVNVEVDACAPSYAPLSPEGQSYTRTCDTHPKQEQSLATIQRSRSRQRALEVRNSAKTSGKSRLGITNDVVAHSQNKSCQDDEQLFGSRASPVGFVRPFSLSTEKCYEKDASVKMTDARFGLLQQSEDNDSKIVHASDDRKDKNSSVYGNRITISNSRCQNSMYMPTEFATPGCFEQRVGSREILECDKAFTSPTEICPLQKAGTKTCSTKRTGDACNSSLTKSADFEVKEVQTSDSRKKEKHSTVCVGRITRSSNCSQQLKDVSSSIKTHGSCEQLNGSTEFRGSYQSPAVPSEICFSGEAEVGLCLTKGSCDAGDVALQTSSDSKVVDGKPRDEGEKEKSISITPGRITTSTSRSDSSMGIPSSSNLSGHGKIFKDVRESELVKQTASCMGISTKDEGATGNRNSEMQHQEDLGRNGMTNMVCEHKQTPAYCLSNDPQKIITEPSDCSAEQLEVKTNLDSLELRSARIIGSVVNGQDVVDNNSSGLLPVSNKTVDFEKSLQAVKKLNFSIVSPVIESMDVDEPDQAMPELESFGAQHFGDELLYKEIPFPSLHEHISSSSCLIPPVSPFPAACKSSVRIDKNPDVRSSLPEQPCNSATLSTPASLFPAVCNLFLEPGIYSSVPNGLLENIDLRSNLLPVGSALQRKTRSDHFSFPRNQGGLEFRKPFLSSTGKGLESTSNSGGSEKLNSGNPELTCFTILEDPESSEEDFNEAKTGMEGTELSMQSSSIREPLCDVTQKNATSLVPDHADEKRSSESRSTEIAVSEVCNVDSQANAMSHRRSTRTTRGKENKGFSVGGNSFKKNPKAHSSRFSKPKLSGTSGLRSRGLSMSEKEPKCNNIVSNVKSFIPLERRKPPAAAAPVKRDVKVKALEAAEAAKRLAEKREDERKKKKEELKNERARMEQEKLKQLELAKELKVELRKKREVENAAKRKQREEEDKKEKEKKRRRVEDARCQQKQAEEKIHAWRAELRYGAEEERKLEGKETNKKAQNEVDRASEASILIKPTSELVNGGSVNAESGDGIPMFNDHQISTEPLQFGKVDSIVTAETLTPDCNKSDKSISLITKEQSYDISPYQCSDDEEEDDDEMPNKKFIPSWASKSCVLLALSSQQHMDPDTIFPPGSFCSLEEVLVPRRLPQDSTK